MYYHSNYNRNNRGSSGSNWLNTILNFFANAFAWIKSKLFKNWSWRKSLKYGLYLMALGLISGSILFFVVSLSLPSPNKLSARAVAQSTKIYARDETTLLYEIHGEAKRTLVQLDDIPDYMEQATIAIEDRNFYKNQGIEITGIIRALFKNFQSGDLTGQGGSTITQQFVKNAVLTNEKTYTRKIKEAVLAIQIEQRFEKDEILQMYLNEIPYGQNAYGVEAAAQTYFAKSARDLTLAESAYLAAIPQAPTFYSPNGPNRDRLEFRKNLVLDEMFAQGYITADQRDEAKKQEVAFSKIKTAIKAPHFVLYVQQLLAEQYGEKTLEEGGLKVITTLDWRLQEIAEQAIKDGVARNETRYKAENAALVSIDPRNGQILAMVGSRDYFDEKYDGQVNVAIRERQPGSSFKPYVYAAGFEEGMSPATMLMDVRTTFGTYGGQAYAPSNYDGSSHGPVSVRKALAGSLNVPAVKTLYLTGVQDAINVASAMGIQSQMDTDRCGLSLVLGGCEVTLLDHTSAMGVFANMGERHDHTPILKITDSNNKVLKEYKEAGREVIDPRTAYQIVDIMTDNSARAYVFGSQSPLILPGNRPVGAKTGTTQEWKDGWTMGYTPSLATGVWTGNNDGRLMSAGADGVLTAAPIWNQFMRGATENTPVEQFQQPDGIQRILVDSVSGKLPTQYTPQTKSEVFSSEFLPKEEDDVHVGVEVNRLNGLLATDDTPDDLRETRVYTVLKSEQPNNENWEAPVRAWAKAAGYEQPPTEYDDGEYDDEGNDISTRLSFVTPTDNAKVGQTFNVRVSVSGQEKPESVELYLEGEYMGRRSNAPYNFNITAETTGWKTLMAVADMPDNERIQYSIRVQVTEDAGGSNESLTDTLFSLPKSKPDKTPKNKKN
jgi:1A family penicillin-binding protein